MRVLDLFSGIGGFSLGLERAGMETVAFCEIDPFCRKVLRKHWPDVPIYDDVVEVSRERFEADGITGIDVIAGGFPCQPFSTASAGKRYGEAHDSYLWPEMLRIVSEFKPTWVIGENVIGIDGMALERVVSDLEASGYEVAPPFEIPACAVGHDHRRARIWFLAHSNGSSESGRTVNAKASELSRGDSHAARMGAQDGLPRKMDRHRLKALGNAVVPQIPEYIGRAIMECEA